MPGSGHVVADFLLQERDRRRSSIYAADPGRRPCLFTWHSHVWYCDM